MIIKRISAFVLAVSMLALSACGAGNTVPAVTEAAEETKVQTLAETESESAPETESEAAENAAPPELSFDFTDDNIEAQKRGTVILRRVDDEEASDGSALWVFNRNDPWNGFQFDANAFRGNEIKATASFRSANPSVKISVQYSVNGNTAYNGIATVNTSESKYSEGSGTFVIPKGADDILVYAESDRLEDIYCDYFKVEVVGDYTLYSEPEEVGFADTSEYPSLKDEYADYFRMGVAVTDTVIKREEYANLIKAQYNSMTLGNNFKPDAILDHNKCVADLDKYMYAPAVNFKSVKTELDFARDNGLTVRGHTLVWHNQTPEWIFYKDYKVGSEYADRDTMLQRLENYIKTVLEWTEENYPGLVRAWDVVNEAADDGGGMRKSLWYQTIGDDYIEKAFEYARKYAPADTKLFYNDYNSYQLKKQNDIITFLRPVVEAGNIDGIGMQSHLNTDISVSLFMAALRKYHDELGLEINITELDVCRKGGDNWKEVQGAYYRSFMTELIKLRQEGLPITSVTLWGVSDADSWLAADYPLIFADDLSRKPAFEGMIEAARGAS